MSSGSEEPRTPPAKPMPAIEEFRVFVTEIPHLIGLGFDTPIGSVLLAADRKCVLEMIAKLQQVAEQMREPS
jgi:hypothetical protein